MSDATDTRFEILGPQAMGGLVDEAAVQRRVERATAESMHPTRDALDLLIGCIDLTTLEGSDTPERVRDLCERGVLPDPGAPDVGPVAAVCVYPMMVPTAAQALQGTPVRVASVAGGFPAGLSSLAVRLADIADALQSGAQEIDFVLNRSAFLSGDLETTYHEVVASIDAAGAATTKVILEVGELGSLTNVRRAALIAMAAGADFIKTSTGKIAESATLGTTICLADAIADFHTERGRKVGLKIAGGVRTTEDALRYAGIVRRQLGSEWLTPERFRFGASRLLDALVEDRRGLARTL